jgi:putative redox protein
MEGKLIWNSGMSFSGFTGTGFTVPIDVSVKNGGTGKGPTPMELVLLSLGGCTAMDVISILQKKRQDVTSFEILMHAERAADHPKVFTNITLEYVVTGHNVEEEAVSRAVELSETKYCSVNAMLSRSVAIFTKVTVKEA